MVRYRSIGLPGLGKDVMPRPAQLVAAGHSATWDHSGSTLFLRVRGRWWTKCEYVRARACTLRACARVCLLCGLFQGGRRALVPTWLLLALLPPHHQVACGPRWAFCWIKHARPIQSSRVAVHCAILSFMSDFGVRRGFLLRTMIRGAPMNVELLAHCEAV
jgi:hypothetical protein